MQFGTFHLIGNPRHVPAKQRFDATLEQVALADELGFDCVWFAEHHFSDYGYAVNPLMLIAKASSVGKRIRFGQAVVVTPFWHPLRLAEDVALADILTDGRLEVGVGRGYQRMEFDGFNVDIAENRALFDEQMTLVRKAWTEDDFTFDGRYYQVRRPTTVVPRPLQQPFPPMWLASSSLSSVDLAAVEGWGVLVSAGNYDRESLIAKRARYLEQWAAAGRAPQDARMALSRFIYVTETEEQARRAIWQTRWQRLIADALKNPDHQISGGHNDPYDAFDDRPDDAWWDRLVYGTPERCIAQIQRDLDAGFNYIIGAFDIGGLPGDEVLRSMRLFATEVMPAFRGDLRTSRPADSQPAAASATLSPAGRV